MQHSSSRVSNGAEESSNHPLSLSAVDSSARRPEGELRGYQMVVSQSEVSLLSMRWLESQLSRSEPSGGFQLSQDWLVEDGEAGLDSLLIH